jgi:hypothetical protein
MARPYAKLRAALFERELTQTDVARLLGRDARYVSVRMCGHSPWGQDEMYKLLSALSAPAEQMHVYFPPNGQNEAGCTKGVR